MDETLDQAGLLGVKDWCSSTYSTLSIANWSLAFKLSLNMLQVQNLLEEPIGLALYTIKDGQLSHACVQGGNATTIDWE